MNAGDRSLPLCRVLRFFLLVLTLAGISTRAIPLIGDARILLTDDGGADRILMNPFDRTAWWAPTPHESGLVRETIDPLQADAVARAGGFPIYSGEPYFATIGLQARIIRRFAPADASGSDAYLALVERIFALLAAVPTALFIFAAARRFGGTSAAVLAVLAATAFHERQFARSIYWAHAAISAPFLVQWLLYERLSATDRGMKLAAAIAAALVFLKALSGYEFISNVILSAAIPAVFVESARDMAPLRILRRGTLILLAGAAGFAAAAALHILLLRGVTHSFADAAAIFAERAANRTVGGAVNASAWPKDASLVRIVADIARSDAGVLALRGRTLLRWSVEDVMMLAALTAAVYGLLAATRRIARDRILERLFPTTIAAFIASLSWAVLAPAHTAPHPHLAPFIFSLPFLPMAAVTIGRGLFAIILPLFGNRSRGAILEPDQRPAEDRRTNE